MWYTKDAPVILNYYVTCILPVLSNTTTLVAGPCGPVRYGQLSYVHSNAKQPKAAGITNFLRRSRRISLLPKSSAL